MAQHTQSRNSFGTKSTLATADGSATIFRLDALAATYPSIARLPFSIRVLLESLLRHEDDHLVSATDIEKLCRYDAKNPGDVEIPFRPARVILQDFTGVPAVVDLAAMRSAVERLGGDPRQINPQIPVDLVVDHSVQVDVHNSPHALQRNAEIEFERNNERYRFLRWGQQAFSNFNVVPPASGIVHQVNLERLATCVVHAHRGGEMLLYPDSLVGTDSHTTMINGLGVLGWGVGGIEAEAVMLGQPIYMLAPEVVGFCFRGALPPGATATDLALRVTQMLRRQGVVGKFVEYHGPGLANLTLSDRATVANMAPEYGATVGFFPVDDETLKYLRETGRSAQVVDGVERYCKEQGLFRSNNAAEPEYTQTLELDLATVEPSVAGPKRPQDRIAISQLKKTWHNALTAPTQERGFALSESQLSRSATAQLDESTEETLKHGSVVIAAITSCTNTSNPAVMLAAGLLAKKAVESGLSVRQSVKASLAPGSRVVTAYLKKAGLLPFLEQLGFFTVGYGCTTCIGNSGPLDQPVADTIQQNDLIAASVLSGNRNFEGRINPLTRANFLASPPLVVAYALAGTIDIDLTRDPIGVGAEGKSVFLADIWPSGAELTAVMGAATDASLYDDVYHDIGNANDLWNKIDVSGSDLYPWDETSTYIQEPPFFIDMPSEAPPITPITKAHVLVKVGDSVTTDHISPAGAIPADSPAGTYLQGQGVSVRDFNSFGSRRGNDRVMTRGTFGNIRLRNQLAPQTEGGWTTHLPSGDVISIFEAAQRYAETETPTIVLAGNDYGMGSSRDWAAKGTFLLGVRAVIAKSFERIHRSNLIGMGVLPLQFAEGEDASTLQLDGSEVFTIQVDDTLSPGQTVTVDVVGNNGNIRAIRTRCRIDTPVEVDYYRNGGILQTVLRGLAKR